MIKTAQTGRKQLRKCRKYFPYETTSSDQFHLSDAINVAGDASLVPFSSVTQSCPIFATPWTAACQHHQLPELAQTHVHRVNDAISSSVVTVLLLPSIFPSIRVFSKESVFCIRWPKYWCFSFSNSPSNESSGLISFRSHCFDLPVVQGTLKSPLQHTFFSKNLKGYTINE